MNLNWFKLTKNAQYFLNMSYKALQLTKGKLFALEY